MKLDVQMSADQKLVKLIKAVIVLKKQNEK